MKEELSGSMEGFCAYILGKMADRNLVVGPWCWMPSDGTKSKIWYFMVSTCDTGGEWRSDQICADEDVRGLFVAEMAKQAHERKLNLIFHTFEDELDAIRFCEIVWPGDRVSRIRKAIEHERQAEVSHG